MSGWPKLALGVLVFGWCSTMVGQARLADPKLHALVVQGIDFTWRQDFVRADSIFDSIIREFPDHPAGFIYKAGLLLTFAEDHESLLDRARFDSLLDEGRRRAGAMIAREADASWGHFYLATADGSDSYARVYRGDWLGGTVKGLGSVEGFEQALKLDSSMIDAYAGIGAYNYWRSKKTEYFNWLPFVGDARPEAFRMLRKTAEAGIYNRYTALSMLAAVYLDAEKYDEAKACAGLGLKTYPSNRTFLWALSTVHDRTKDFEQAARSYSELLESTEKDPAGNPYNEFVARLNLAESLGRIGDVRRAKSLVAVTLRARPEQFAEHLRNRVRSNLERARSLEKRLLASPAESR